MASSDDRLADLERRLAAIPDPEVGSVDELMRAEQVRFSARFAQRAPQFRTQLRVRFFGPGVDGHDLVGEVAGSIIKRLSETVKAAGASIRNTKPDAFHLFLSPAVAPGSTILELYGAPREGADPSSTLGSAIVDTPVDAAIERMFRTVELAAQNRDVDGVMGKPLFALAKDLIDGDVDMDLAWRRPRGASRTLTFDRGRARYLRDMLDRETSEDIRRDGIGELVSVSTDGQVGIRLTGAKRTLRVSTDGFEIEDLRALWARQVRATWIETTVSHPQRDTHKTSSALVSVVLDDSPTGQELQS